jgi:hypothetical protein
MTGINTNANPRFIINLVNMNLSCSNLCPILVPCPAVFSITAVHPFCFVKNNVNRFGYTTEALFFIYCLKMTTRDENSVCQDQAVHIVAFHQEMKLLIFPEVLSQGVPDLSGSYRAVESEMVCSQASHNSPGKALILALDNGFENHCL